MPCPPDPSLPGPATLEIEVAQGVRIVVPARLNQITPYVLLEQEGWFEKEADFLPRCLEPGDEAIDVGANLGLYALPLAKAVGPRGRVIAYEPAAATRALLALSRARNAADCLDIRAEALSDAPRPGHLAHARSSELNALGAAGEAIAITSLDAEDAAGRWRDPAVVKLDAEGEEARILAGGAGFFARHAPLVMFEVKAGNAVDESLRGAFPTMGYGIFRLLPGGILIPDHPASPLDAYELNLFAAKPRRAATLAERGLLVTALPPLVLDEIARDGALAPLLAMPFAARSEFWSEPLDPIWLRILTAAAHWADARVAWPSRIAGLREAFGQAQAAAAQRATPARLATLTRLAWEWGARSVSAAAARQLVQQCRPGQGFRLDEPFWPPHGRFDNIDPGQSLADWFTAAAVEQEECSAHFSSIFGGGTPLLGWLSRQPFASAAMLRRHALLAARAGAPAPIDSRLREAAPDHRNPALWQNGVPAGFG